MSDVSITDAGTGGETAASDITTSGVFGVSEVACTKRASVVLNAALLYGWSLRLSDGSAAGFRPGGNTAWEVSWSSGGTVFRRRSTRVSRAAVRRMIASGIEELPRMVRCNEDELADVVLVKFPAADGVVCRCCGGSWPPAAELSLTAAGLCWSCDDSHEIEQPLFTEFPSLSCARRGHSNGRGVPVEELWRLDPRTKPWGVSGDVVEADFDGWLSERGVESVDCWGRVDHVVSVRGQVIFEDHSEDGWLFRGKGRRTRISQPARHEILQVLLANQLPAVLRRR